MDEMTLARTLHVLGVVLWIGGVGFVTTVLLPSVRQVADPARRVELFEEIERRFAWQARGTTLLVGATGLYLTVTLDLWNRFVEAQFWWMHAMILVWLVFSVMLFVAEPLFLSRWFRRAASARPEATFRLIESLHLALLGISLLTVPGAVAGSHGSAF